MLKFSGSSPHRRGPMPSLPHQAGGDSQDRGRLAWHSRGERRRSLPPGCYPPWLLLLELCVCVCCFSLTLRRWRQERTQGFARPLGRWVPCNPSFFLRPPQPRGLATSPVPSGCCCVFTECSLAVAPGRQDLLAGHLQRTPPGLLLVPNAVSVGFPLSILSTPFFSASESFL